jgi:hypothetical protein
LAGVWILLIALALAAGGVLFAAAPFGEPVPLWIRVGAALFAAVASGFAALGFLITFAGERITIDQATRTIHVRYGRWCTWKRTSRSFNDFHAVRLDARSTRVGTEHSGQVAYVTLLLAGGDELELAQTHSDVKGRATAERVANLLNLPLHDTTHRETVVRAAGLLDESLAERAHRLGERPAWPRPPRNSRIEIRTLGDETVLILPRPSRKLLFEGVIGLGFLLVVYGGTLGYAAYSLRAWVTRQSFYADNALMQAAVWALPLVPVLYILIAGVVLLIAREHVAVSPRMLKRTWRLPIGSWTRRIPTDAIEDLRRDTDDVVIGTDRGKCRIGFTLTRSERRWLRDALHYLLVHGVR